MTIAMSPAFKYLAAVFVIVLSVVVSYWLKYLPDTYGLTGISTSITAAAYFASHDLQSEGSQAHIPAIVSFIVVSAAAAVQGAIGAFGGVSGLTQSAFFGWLVVVFTLLVHAVKEDQGASAPANEEAWAVSIFGVSIGVFGYLASHLDPANPVTISSLVATLAAVIPLYIHLGTDGQGNVTVAPTSPPS